MTNSIQQMERKIVRRIIREAIAIGGTVSLHDGEAWAVVTSAREREIMEHVGSTDTQTLLIRDRNGERMGRVYLIFGNDGYDVVSDYSVSLEWFMKSVNEYSDILEGITFG
jgi:hypothetical protein